MRRLIIYDFDGGPTTPVSFDPASGSFDQPLDLSRLASGHHTLDLQATDAAGNTTSTSVQVSLATAIPLTIASVASRCRALPSA